MMLHWLSQTNLIAGILLAAAFLLTFWRQRPSWWFAAGCYTAGLLICVGAKVCLWVLSLCMAVALSDSSQTYIPWAGLLFPIAASIYVIASVILLWPWISRKNAMRFGKCLHLIYLPVLFSILLICAFVTRGQGQVMPELQWLVFGPLWFRIRERFVAKGGSY